MYIFPHWITTWHSVEWILLVSDFPQVGKRIIQWVMIYYITTTRFFAEYQMTQSIVSDGNIKSTIIFGRRAPQNGIMLEPFVYILIYFCHLFDIFILWIKSLRMSFVIDKPKNSHVPQIHHRYNQSLRKLGLRRWPLSPMFSRLSRSHPVLLPSYFCNGDSILTFESEGSLRSFQL